jgi:hypothetical protein
MGGKNSMRKLLLIIILVLTFSLCATPNTTVQFKDLDEHHWAAQPIYNCVRLGITKGYPDGTFRGDKPINRYELMVFLNNTAIALEKMMDDKLENAMFAGESETNNRALDELKAELEVLKEQVVAGSATGGATNKGNGPFIHGTYDIYGGTHGTKGKDHFWENQYFHRLAVFVSGNINETSGYLAGIDTAQINWGPNADTENILLINDVFEAEAHTSKKFGNDFNLRFAFTKGPGEIKMANKKIASRRDDAIFGGFDLYGVSTTLKYAVLGTTGNFDLDGDGISENLRINEFSPSITYTIPVRLPYLGYWTLGYNMTQFSTEKSRNANNVVRVSRYTQFNNFEITDKVNWTTKYTKEVSYVPTVDIDGDAIHNERQGYYYDSSFIFGDIFNSGTTWQLSYAYRGRYFGTTGLLEPPAGINLLGYESCGYFFDDWTNTNRMPSANIVSEGGGRITQNLYKDKLFLNLIYISGTGIPDPDNVLPNDEEDNTKYFYTLGLAGLNWDINDNFNLYLNLEQKTLRDTSIEDDSDQYSDTFTYLGLRAIF